MDQIGKRSATAGNNGTVARAMDEASNSAHDAIDKVAATVAPAMDRLSSGAHQAVDSAASAASGAAESLAAKASQLAEGHTLMTNQCRGYVRANPLASLGIAVAAGFVLSRLIGRR